MGEWLLSVASAASTRILAALGIGTVTYTGMSAAITSATDAAKTAFGGLTGDVLQLVLMSGFPDALAIASGSLFSAVALVALKHFALNVTAS